MPFSGHFSQSIRPPPLIGRMLRMHGHLSPQIHSCQCFIRGRQGTGMPTFYGRRSNMRGAPTLALACNYVPVFKEDRHAPTGGCPRNSEATLHPTWHAISNFYFTKKVPPHPEWTPPSETPPLMYRSAGLTGGSCPASVAFSGR
jgi:hypothetical protein